MKFSGDVCFYRLSIAEM